MHTTQPTAPCRAPSPPAPLTALVLILAATAQAQPPPCPDCIEQTTIPADDTQPAQSPATARIEGLDELRFNPLSGRFVVQITGAKLTSDADRIRLFVNNRQLPPGSFALSRSAITVDYHFKPGLNEVLVTAADTDGRRIRADGLYWAGRRSLIVDVTDPDQNPLDGVRVTVRLGQAAAVRAIAVTTGGAARFENIPARSVVIEAAADGYLGAGAAPPDDAWSVLLVLSPQSDPASAQPWQRDK